MPFKRYVEIGRVCLINFGEDYGKLVIISDIVDQNRALIDSPEPGFVRRMENFKRLSLTDLKVEIARLPRKKVLTAQVAEADIFAKFAASAWGQKLAKRVVNAASTDFDRFKSAVAKTKRSRLVRKVFNQMKKSAA
ncbi:MAG: hypothetical protein WDW38_002915 [Sanguina aurantia]